MPLQPPPALSPPPTLPSPSNAAGPPSTLPDEVLTLWDSENCPRPRNVNLWSFQHALEHVLIASGYMADGTRHRIVASQDMARLPGGVEGDAMRREWTFVRDGDISMIDSGPKAEAADHVLRTQLLAALLRLLRERVGVFGRAGLSSPWEPPCDRERAIIADAEATGTTVTRRRCLVVIISSDGDFIHHIGDVGEFGQRCVVVTKAHGAYHGITTGGIVDSIPWSSLVDRAEGLAALRAREREMLQRGQLQVLRAPSRARLRGGSGYGSSGRDGDDHDDQQ